MAAKSKYIFLTEPDDALKCPICLEVAEEPRQHGKCGKLFCEACLEKCGKHKPCPNCKRVGPLYFEDSRSKRDIAALGVKCSNVEECEWEGTVGTLQPHVDACDFTLVLCPQKCKGDDKKVNWFARKDLANHLKDECSNRDYECKHCGEKGAYANIAQVHDKKCGKKIVPCPNADCTETIERQGIERHLDDCVHTEVPCKYQKIGCDVKMKRNANISSHEDDDKVHLQIALNTITSMEEKMADMKVKVLRSGESFPFRVDNFAEKKNQSISFISPAFYTGPNGYLMKIYGNPNGEEEDGDEHLSIYVTFKEGKNDSELSWPFVGNITFTLLNQLADNNHFKRCCSLPRKSDVRPGISWGYAKFISHTKLSHIDSTTWQYLKDDTLYFRVSVEMPQSKPWLEWI